MRYLIMSWLATVVPNHHCLVHKYIHICTYVPDQWFPAPMLIPGNNNRSWGCEDFSTSLPCSCNQQQAPWSHDVLIPWCFPFQEFFQQIQTLTFGFSKNNWRFWPTTLSVSSYLRSAIWSHWWSGESLCTMRVQWIQGPEWVQWEVSVNVGVGHEVFWLFILSWNAN